MQVKNLCRTSTTNDTNAQHAVMLECKLAQGKADAFVWDIKAAPELMAVCYSDWHIMGLQPFCTNPSEVTVMCADTTYTLINSPHWAYVWGYSYRKTTLATWSSSCTSADEVYFNCSASLNDADKSMWYVQAFGTDGDTNLSDALSHCFPFATFRYFIHVEHNLHEKLREFNIPK